MKKLLKFFLVICLILCTFTVIASAKIYSGEYGENATWSLDTSTGVFTISGTGTNTTFYYYASPWQEHCKSIKTVIIEDGITEICQFAFYGCTNLTSITIPDSVSKIGHLAFYGCDNLTGVTIPDSIRYIDPGAFDYCEQLKTQENGLVYIKANNNPYFLLIDGTSDISSTCTINENTRFICNYAFLDCKTLESITIPNSVVSILDRAFGWCINLTSITIPDSVTYIGNSVFANSDRLTIYGYKGSYAETFAKENGIPFELMPYEFDAATGTLTVYNDDYSLDAWDDYRANIKTVIIEDGVTIIGYEAFCDCTALTNVTIPNSVTYIETSAFDGCKSLTSITIPDSVTWINDCAFADCSSLTSITIPNSVTSIGAAAFSGCTNLMNTVDNLIYIKTTSNPYFYLYGAANNSITSCTINANTKFIGDSAFQNCISLTSVTLPDGITYISDSAFSGCSALKNINIPNGVRSIYNYAFAGCTSLTSITIPDSLVGIGMSAFSGAGITSITLPSSVEYIHNGTFEFCNLTSITIPDSMTEIPNWAFIGCTNLTSITIPSSVTSIGAETFDGCTSLTIYGYKDSSAERYAKENNIPFVELKTWTFDSATGTLTIKTNFFHDMEDSSPIYPWYEDRHNIKTAILEPGANLYFRTFLDCSNLTSVTLPNTVTRIGELTFGLCSSLTSITIPNSVTYIEAAAFSDCTNLKSIIIPSSVTFIDPEAFWECPSLTIYGESGSYAETYAKENGINFAPIACNFDAATGTLTIKSGCKMDGAYLWDEYKKEIKTVIIESGVTNIGDSAFAGCTALTSITIPKSVNSIDACAFMECTSLTNITIPYGVRNIGIGAFSGCVALTDITLPYGVKSIGDSAFYNCTGLKSIIIPESVTEIGNGVFDNCNSLTIHCYVHSDAYKYAKKNDKNYNLLPPDNRIIMTIDSTDAFVFGKPQKTDVPPIIENNRTMLPVRFVAENLGATVGWDGVTRTATITGNGVTIKITVDSNVAYVNGKEVTLDAPAFIRSNRTYLPVRFIAESLGATVGWDGATRTATITKN